MKAFLILLFAPAILLGFVLKQQSLKFVPTESDSYVGNSVSISGNMLLSGLVKTHFGC
jgi:hypothetical protein